MLIALYSMLIEAGSVASGDVVNWVMFPDWVNSDYVGRGTSPELDVTTTFRLHDGEISVGNPRFITPGGRIADPNWPFENDQVPTFIAVPPGGLLRYMARPIKNVPLVLLVICVSR
jgi:hypothetical protein